MSTQNALDEVGGKTLPFWPQDAVPERWITELFTRMHRLWGNTFLDKWRDVEMAGLKVEWAKALKKLSSKELKAGVDALLTLKFPPHLPEFYSLCKNSRLVDAAAEAPKLELPRATPDVVEANLARMRQIMAPLMFPKEPTAEWAYRLLKRGNTGLPYEVLRCATDAISSPADKQVVTDCPDEELKAEYEVIRQTIVDDYRMRGKPLWGTQ